MSSPTTPPKQVPPGLYDLALQGVPERIFIGPRRRALVKGLSGLVLEIGAGTGFSLRYYAPAAHVIATEPDLPALPRLTRRAKKAGAPVEVAAADASRLPFAEGLFDAVVCQLALCTIPDPSLALSEVRRVLKPGGEARFLEHVRADGQVRPWVQDRVAPLWARMAGGCRLNQRTEEIITASGLEVQRVHEMPGLLLPMKLIWTHNP